MLCAISGEAPQAPVVSRKSGIVYEKRLIEDYIKEHGTDPVNGEELTLDDLLEIQSSRTVRPRPPTFTSIPSLLSAFQNEWDTLMLESYTLKQQLAQTRQELSTALYQHDAATRVIARLTRERDESRNALSRITVSSGGAAGHGDEMQVDTQELPDAIKQKIEATQAKLSSTRRKRPIPEGWTTADTIQTFDASTTTEPIYPGSHSLGVNKSGELAVFGGADGVAGVYSITDNQIVQTLKAEGAVTNAIWWADKPILATSTGLVRIFADGQVAGEYQQHAGAVTGLSLHPSGDLLVSIGVDKSYILYDLSSGKVITQVFSDSDLTTGSFHPDGHLLALGTSSGEIQLYTVANSEKAVTFAASGAIASISFSENGTWLASASKGSSSISVWDLRKQSMIKEIEIGSPVTSVVWDYTGQFLAAGGPSCVAVQQYNKSSKAWSEPFRKAVSANDVAWGASAASLLVLNKDGGVILLEAA